MLASWTRTGVLSYPSVAFKLSSAAAEGLAFNTLYDAAASAQQIVPGVRNVARMAPTESGLNLRAEAHAYTASVIETVFKRASSTKLPFICTKKFLSNERSYPFSPLNSSTHPKSAVRTVNLCSDESRN